MPEFSKIPTAIKTGYAVLLKYGNLDKENIAVTKIIDIDNKLNKCFPDLY